LATAILALGDDKIAKSLADWRAKQAAAIPLEPKDEP
jgi:hypothetical protein